MRTLLLLASLFTCLLSSSCPANAQQRSDSTFLAVPLLPAKIAFIPAGTTVGRDLIGFTPAAYQELRREMAIGERLLVVRSGDLAAVRNLHRLDSLTSERRSQEIQRLRTVVAARDAELTRQEVLQARILSRPLQKPFLLDPHTWVGALVGVVAGGVLVLAR